MGLNTIVKYQSLTLCDDYFFFWQSLTQECSNSRERGNKFKIFKAGMADQTTPTLHALHILTTIELFDKVNLIKSQLFPSPHIYTSSLHIIFTILIHSPPINTTHNKFSQDLFPLEWGMQP